MAPALHVKGWCMGDIIIARSLDKRKSDRWLIYQPAREGTGRSLTGGCCTPAAVLGWGCRRLGLPQ